MTANEKPKRVIWHPQDVKILTEIVTNMKNKLSPATISLNKHWFKQEKLSQIQPS